MSGLENELERAMRHPDVLRNIAKREGRIAVNYKTTAEWNSMPWLIAEKGSFYVYSDNAVVTDNDGNRKYIPGIKIGDGTSFLIDMPFAAGDVSAGLDAHIANTSVHIQPGERSFWGGKVSAYLDSADNENLVLSDEM